MEQLSPPREASESEERMTRVPKPRSYSETALSSLLMPELLRIAQTIGIPGAGRMRKAQLIEAIAARQGAQR